MADPTLMDAALIWAQRKVNAGIESTEAREEDDSRLLVSGFDIDYEELLSFKKKIAAGSFEAAIDNPLPEVFSGMWVDGLITGIIYQELREKAKHDAS